MTKSEFQNSIYMMLNRLMPDEPVKIMDLMGSDVLPNEKAIPFFMAIVKDFIRRDEGRHTGNFYCEFSNDYTKLRRMQYR